jgi:hypothetical protein
MGWIIILLMLIAALLAVVVWRLAAIQAALNFQFAKLRLEIGAGLGVNVENPNGYLDGGHLTELRDDMRARNRRERLAQDQSLS